MSYGYSVFFSVIPTEFNLKKPRRIAPLAFYELAKSYRYVDIKVGVTAAYQSPFAISCKLHRSIWG
jgi:hypothetical protein